MQNKRFPNFEILRVLSMLFVILAHYLNWGTVNNIVGGSNIYFLNGSVINSLAFPFLNALCFMGVIGFVMITGFFISNDNSIRFDRLLKTWLQVLFYSSLIGVIFSLFHLSEFKEMLLSFLPIYSDQYWFVTKYIALLLLAPFFALLIGYLSKSAFIYLLIVLSILTVTITHGFPYGDVVFSDNPYSLSVFILLFFIAAYIRKFGEPSFFARYSGLIFISFILIQGIIGLGVNYLCHSNDTIYGGFSAWYNGLSLIPGIALFIWFKNHSFGDNVFTRFLIKIAPYSFAVYLIHDNPLLRDFLWGKIFTPAKYWNSPLWLFYAFIIPMAIFIICVVIDIIRCYLFKLSKINTIPTIIRRYNITLSK